MSITLKRKVVRGRICLIGNIFSSKHLDPYNGSFVKIEMPESLEEVGALFALIGNRKIKLEYVCPQFPGKVLFHQVPSKEAHEPSHYKSQHIQPISLVELARQQRAMRRLELLRNYGPELDRVGSHILTTEKDFD